MNFKIKIILLILSVSLVPYVLLMTYAGSTLREKYYENTQHELSMQLQLTVDKIEQYFTTLQRDMVFLSQLEIMDDIFSKDVDRRISNLLQKKKKELHIEGDFFVVDTNKIIISSSNPQYILTKATYVPFFSQAIYSPFDKSIIGYLEIEFSLKNIVKLFGDFKQKHYYIVKDGTEVLYKKESFLEKIEVRKKLYTKKNLTIVAEQNKNGFLSQLHKYELIFIAALLIGIVIIGMIALFFITRLIRPIIELSNIAEEVTKKQDYSYQVKVYSNDEIGKLSIAFNKMIQGMHKAFLRLKEESINRENLVVEKSKNEMLENLSTKLARYLSPQVYESIFLGEQDVTLTSQRKKLTIFFSDIVGFTDTTDMMESEDLSELLNDYLNEMTLTALKYGATVDKYMGDAIMLFFGDPQSKGIEQDALACVAMAIEMKSKMVTLHQRWKKRGFTKPFSVRVGIHTGYCTVGNFGSQDRLEYTIIGSSVNLANRIETQASPDEILISEETKNLVSSRFKCIKSKEIIPKGLTRSIKLYSVEVTKKDEKVQVIDISKDGFTLRCDVDKLSEKDKDTLKKELLEVVEII